MNFYVRTAFELSTVSKVGLLCSCFVNYLWCIYTRQENSKKSFRDEKIGGGGDPWSSLLFLFITSLLYIPFTASIIFKFQNNDWFHLAILIYFIILFASLIRILFYLYLYSSISIENSFIVY